MSSDSAENVESPAVRAARERFAMLQKKSNKLDPERATLAEISENEVAELRRLDKEGWEALRQEAHIREAEAWAKLTPEQQEKTSIECVYDWPTHKATGRGIIVFRQLDSGAAAEAMKPTAKLGGDGMALFDNSPEMQVKNLVKVALYPSPGDVQLICAESPVFASLAHQSVMNLSGLNASRTLGKSTG